MLEVAVIDDAAAAEISLDPVRVQLLAALIEPGSASTLAVGSDLSRQKINYHLRALEKHGLIELVQERQRGNFTERVLQATAASYVISPQAFAAVAPDPDRAPDAFSAWWMLALGSRLIQEVGTLVGGATKAGKPLATFAIDSELTFASAADRAGFAKELAQALAGLVDKYHAAPDAGGRRHRLVLALHPSLKQPTELDPGNP